VVHVVIRSESPDDYAAIRHVNEAAFGTSEEATLIEQLRTDGVVLLSLVAVMDGRIVGHILFSRMSIDTKVGRVAAVALAPLAVSPDCQRKGIGGTLIRHGLNALREMAERTVIVVGHPEYYPRFGFSTAVVQAVKHPFPANVFMALELEPGALNGVVGKVQYPTAFGIA